MIDLFAGLGGWAEGGLGEGYDVVGFDIERHVYGEHRYPATLVIQDVLTLHGRQFKDAALIVASPPCQEFSYMAMPWSLAKAKAAAIRADTSGKMLADLTALFDACFRIQAQASLSAGRVVPLIVENVRGAQPWVGRSRWNFGSYHLWGDVPALMPAVKAFKSSGMNRSDQTKRGQDFTRIAGNQAIGIKGAGATWDAEAGRSKLGVGHWTSPFENGRSDGIKQGGTWWHDPGSVSRISGSGSPSRKAASAMIAKIPLPLARHIAQVYRP
jgi:hypothetical protein